MGKHRYYLFALLVLSFCFELQASERVHHVLFIQSYNTQTPWCADLSRGVQKGLAEAGVNAKVTVEYLDADYWPYSSERIIMKRYCERARSRGTTLIVTAGDEAFHTLLNCGDSLPLNIPVVFFGIKYPDDRLISSLSNVTGFTSNPDYKVILKEARRIFPERKEVICVGDNSALSQKGREDLLNEFLQFQKEHPDYQLKVYNSQAESTDKIISSICYPRHTKGRIVIIPKWSTFSSFIGKNSKAPFFSCQNLALMNGVLGSYDADPYASARAAGERAAKVLKGSDPGALGVTDTPVGFIYDNKQLDYFHVSSSKIDSSTVINEPYWEKYQLLFTLLYTSILALLIFVVGWLMRINRRESRRRMHAQTRLLVQNRLVAQRDEFDNVYHSIRDGLVTYDSDLRIHFTNRALIQMLHLPQGEKVRPYEGSPAGTLFKIYNKGEEVLRNMLKKVVISGHSIVFPEGSFLQEVHSGNYFQVSGEIVPIRAHGKITGVALSCRNVSDEEMQKRFFTMAVEESSIYPWQYNIHTNSFTFPLAYLRRFGFPDGQCVASREEIEEMIHVDDVEHAHTLFDAVIGGFSINTRLNFRQRNALGVYEWWEYRTSVLSGLTADMPYNILGICQSIQRYKNTEEELTAARDKALEADKLKSAFLANMSHEIRTPLNAIVGFSDLLSDTSNFSEEEVSQFITTINKNCGLLLALINDILDLSRIESGSMDFLFVSHNLPLLLRNVYDSQQLNMPSGVKLVLDIPPSDKKYLVTDSVRLQQVVNNLINNAAKFTTSGSITVGYVDDEEPGYTILFVEDTGKGISEDGLRHIFERFYKVDNFTQGAGLGLSICSTIVERLKGTISVTSQEGKGTRFSVRIPDTCE